MKWFQGILVTCSYFYLAVSKSYDNNRQTEYDLIIEVLGGQKWLEYEKPCLEQTLTILNNVKNYTVWAVWIWNSMQHPTGSFYGSKYSLGNYDQCMQAPSNFGQPNIITQYCLTDVKLTNEKDKDYDSGDIFGPTDLFLNIKSPTGRRSNIISWGACLPAVCSHQSVSKILKTIYSLNPISSIDSDIIVDNCQKAGVKTEYSLKFYIFMFIMTLLIITAFTSTYYLEHNKSDTTLTRIAYSFSIKRNWNSFTRISNEEIPVLSFTKAVLTTFTTITHVFIYVMITENISNGNDFDNLFTVEDYGLGNVIRHTDLPGIENFVIISGLLLMKKLMEKNKPIITTLIQRYVRFTAAFSFMIFYTLAVSEYTGDGPLWKKFSSKEQTACSKNWLISLLMLNNYVDNENICQIVSWYIPCDYQLAVIGTILYCIWQWDKRVGKITTIFAAILALLSPGVATYWKKLPGLLIYDLDKMTHYNKNVVFLDTYMKSHHRAGPYLIGMAMGYIIATYRPAKYRGVISKKCSYIGLAAGFIVGFKVLVAAPAWCLGEYNAWNSAIYAALNRNIWALAVCVCIGITEYGDVQTIRNFVAWPLFSFVSRLAYGIYITHSLILQRNFYSLRNPMQHDMFKLILDGIGVCIASAILAILLLLFIESPINNLANLLLNPKTKQTSNRIENKKQ